MADENQLKILRQGVEGWNAWRRENRDQWVILRGADLRAANLIGIDLFRADEAYIDDKHANHDLVIHFTNSIANFTKCDCPDLPV